MSKAFDLQFLLDLDNGHEAERLVASVIEILGGGAYKVADLSSIKEYYYKGDLRVNNIQTKQSVLVEVKNDSRIHQTHNILCEDEVEYKGRGLKKGNMYSDYQIYCVLS